jgi:hypothetical protein
MRGSRVQEPSGSLPAKTPIPRLDESVSSANAVFMKYLCGFFLFMQQIGNSMSGSRKSEFLFLFKN